jgi:NAD(P)H-dependent FMN reductase
MKYQLKIIVGSTRPGRKGIAIAKWFNELAKQNQAFEVEILDLKEINLPFFDEENHPRLQQYTKEHTKNWSKKIAHADAFVVVTPEYNFSYPATLKNALDFLVSEWAEKPMAFVSYGGLSGGTRAVQELKSTVTTLGMVPLTQAVNIPFFTQHINPDGEFIGTESLEKSANGMLNNLLRWTEALKGMRDKNI